MPGHPNSFLQFHVLAFIRQLIPTDQKSASHLLKLTSGARFMKWNTSLPLTDTEVWSIWCQTVGDDVELLDGKLWLRTNTFEELLVFAPMGRSENLGIIDLLCRKARCKCRYLHPLFLLFWLVPRALHSSDHKITIHQTNTSTPLLPLPSRV